MPLSTRPLTARFGAVVEGLDLAAPEVERHFPEIRTLFEHHSALFFPGQALDDSSHRRLARLFGPIEDRNANTRAAGDVAAIPEVSNVRADGTTAAASDLQTLNLQANMLWHADSTFLPVPAIANIITARTVTTTGGQTELASTRAAFADLPMAAQERLRQMRLRHRYAHSRAQISAELAADPMFHKWPDQTWPAVWKNPVTGDEAIYVASHAFEVAGLGPEQSATEIADLIAHCTGSDYVYSHGWTVGDVLIWDQRAILHRGRPWPYEEPRVLRSLCASATEGDGLAAMRAAGTAAPA